MHFLGDGVDEARELSGRGAVRRLDQPATAVADTSRRLPPLRARRDEHAVDEHATVAVLSDGERIAIQAVLLDGLLVGRVDVAVVEPGVIGKLGEDGPRAFVDPDGWVVGEGDRACGHWVTSPDFTVPGTIACRGLQA